MIAAVEGFSERTKAKPSWVLERREAVVSCHTRAPAPGPWFTAES